MISIISIDFTRVTNFIPETMKQLPNWGLWRLISDKDGKLQKVPYSAAYRGFAKSNDPATWSNFRRAVNEYRGDPSFYKGLAFFTDGNGLIFIDIDHCIQEAGELNSVAQEIMSDLGDAVFWELSQSGAGLHGFMYGSIEKSIKNSKDGVEVYSSGRFCAMTGKALVEREPGHNDEGLKTVCEKYQIRKKTTPGTAGDHVPVLARSDSYIIEKAGSNEKSGDLFRQLMGGDVTGFHSRSDADFCLIKILYFWCDGDPETIKRIARTSLLMRDKWNRPDYLDRTIERAREETIETLSGFIQRRRKEEADAYYKSLLQSI